MQLYHLPVYTLRCKTAIEAVQQLFPDGKSLHFHIALHQQLEPPLSYQVRHEAQDPVALCCSALQGLSFASALKYATETPFCILIVITSKTYA